MEDTLSSSRFKFTSISVDSRFADQNYGTPVDTSDFMIRLPDTIKNVMRIKLSSTEIPPVEYSFTKEKDNLSFQITANSITTSYSLQPGNYSTTSLCAAITQISGYTCAINPDTNRFRLSGSSDFTLSFGSSDPNICSRKTHWGLGYYLGFRVPYIVDTSGYPISQRRSITSNSSNSVDAYSAPLVTQNTYYLMQLMCPDQLDTLYHRVTGNTSIPVFAKIIMRNHTYGIDFDDNSDLVRREYVFLAPTNISQIRIRLLDSFGIPVRLNMTDWSMTLEFTEVINSRTYDHFNRTYNVS
jgi:hypothetical protein